jgi:hypothetical protein
MRLAFCAACGCDDADALEHHHLIPRSLGGSDDETNLITLCGVCHGKMHDVKRPKSLSELIKVGHAKAKALDPQWRPGIKPLSISNPEVFAEIDRLYCNDGKSLREIADKVGLPLGTVYDAIRAAGIQRKCAHCGRLFEITQGTGSTPVNPMHVHVCDPIHEKKSPQKYLAS